MPRPRSDVSSRSPFSHSLSCIQTKFMRSAIRDQEGTPIGPMTPSFPQGWSLWTHQEFNRSTSWARQDKRRGLPGGAGWGTGGVECDEDRDEQGPAWMPRGRATVVALSAWSVDPGGGHGDTTAVWGLVSLDVIRGKSVSWNSAGTARGSVVPVVWVGNECCGHLECFPFECPLPLAADQSDRLLALLFREISPTCRET